MKKILQTTLFVWFIIVTKSSFAYEIETHGKLSEATHDASIIAKDPVFLLNLGIKSSDRFPNSRNDSDLKSIRELIRDGANFEDNNTRPLNHFFDPTTDTGLLFTSPTWALEDKGQITALQAYSYADARQYFYDALTKSDKAERDKSFGLLFETLGRVVHHFQDMTQPQHVRLDTHLKLSDQDQPDWFFENRSRYETYTNDIRDSLPFAGYTPVYSGTDTSTFDLPRKFWTTTSGQGNGGKGIAEYTNRGVFSWRGIV